MEPKKLQASPANLIAIVQRKENIFVWCNALKIYVYVHKGQFLRDLNKCEKPHLKYYTEYNGKFNIYIS